MQISGLLHEEMFLILCNEGAMSYMALWGGGERQALCPF